MAKENSDFSSLSGNDPTRNTPPVGPPHGDPNTLKNCPQPGIALSTLSTLSTGPQGQLEIPEGKNFFIDKSIDTGNLVIRGGLYCSDN